MSDMDCCKQLQSMQFEVATLKATLTELKTIIKALNANSNERFDVLASKVEELITRESCE